MQALPRILDALLYICSAGLTAQGLSWLKLAMQAAPVDALVGLAGLAAYGTGTLFWIAVLGRNPFSVAMPVSIGLTVLATYAIASWQLGESVTVWRLVGGGAIVAGVLLVAQR